jgi:hypothetical protein
MVVDAGDVNQLQTLPFDLLGDLFFMETAVGYS